MIGSNAALATVARVPIEVVMMPFVVRTVRRRGRERT
jgi:hypothetical protein